MNFHDMDFKTILGHKSVAEDRGLNKLYARWVGAHGFIRGMWQILSAILDKHPRESQVENVSSVSPAWP